MKFKLALAAIILISFFLRFYKLNEVPPSLSHDEVAIGYNAFSILKTGRDEYGIKFPLLFRSFDDYKLPGMVYFTIPFVAIFGLNEWGVRLPSALLGTLSVLLMYFLIKELFRNSNFSNQISLVVVLLFALQPWAINFSRQAFESNGALFFFLLGIYFLIRFLRQPVSLIFLAIFWAISVYFYYSVRTTIPIVLFVFLVVYPKEILKHFRVSVIAALLFVVIISPLIPYMFSKEGLLRMQIVSVTQDEFYVQRRDQFAKITATHPNLFYRLIFNRRMALAYTVADNYLKNLSAGFIFMSGTGKVGLLHLFELPFFYIGVAALIILIRDKRKWLIFAWFLAAPLSGAFTVNQPNALRTLLNAPVLSLFSGLGLTQIFLFFETKKIEKVFVSFLSFLIFVSLLYFFYQYFIVNHSKDSLSFGDGYKQMVAYLTQNENKYKQIYISGYYWRPYIFVLFWEKYDPTSYQEEGSRFHFGKYLFTAAEWDKEGVFIYDSNFKKEDLKITDLQNTLIMLSGREHEAHAGKFVRIASIDGIFAKEAFVAAKLRE